MIASPQRWDDCWFQETLIVCDRSERTGVRRSHTWISTTLVISSITIVLLRLILWESNLLAIIAVLFLIGLLLATELLVSRVMHLILQISVLLRGVAQWRHVSWGLTSTFIAFSLVTLPVLLLIIHVPQRWMITTLVVRWSVAYGVSIHHFF